MTLSEDPTWEEMTPDRGHWAEDDSGKFWMPPKSELDRERAALVEHLEFADRIVANWPEWKRNLLGLPE